MLLVSITEEVGHVFCACDYALRLNGNDCVFYVPNLASLVPTSYYSLGPKVHVNVKCQ